MFLLRPGVPPQQFARSAGLSNDQVLDIPEDQEGNIWVATQNGLNRLRPDKFVTFDDLSIRHNAAIADLAPANDGSLWIGSRSGLDRLSGVTHHRFATGQAVTALETGDDGGAIYLSGGRLRSTSGSVAHTLPNSSLAPASLLARSRSGPLWRYSRDAGLCRLNLTTGEQTSVPLRPDQIVAAMAADPNGGLWLGLANGTLLLHGEHIDREFTPADGLPAGAPSFLSPGADGTLWLATDRGLRLYDGQRFLPWDKSSGLPDGARQAKQGDRRRSVDCGGHGFPLADQSIFVKRFSRACCVKASSRPDLSSSSSAAGEAR